MIQNNKPEYLYIHVPFCKSICAYCDFAHTVYQTQNVEKWLQAIQQEIIQTHISPYLKTIYIGGGTPSCLSYEQLDTFLTYLDPYTQNIQEYTIEINPETLDTQKASILQKHHINRASIGLQSTNPQLLQLMRRKHTYADVSKTMQLLNAVGITNISLDIMYSLPFQTMDILKQTLQDALLLKPTHLSLYSLTIEENTIFASKGYTPLDEDMEADMYTYICDTLKQNHYIQYEVSNFALDGYTSMHNQAYWNYRDFYGIGCGVSGKQGYQRYDAPKHLKQYLQDPMHKDIIYLTKKDAMFEMVMMGIRLIQGMDLQLFQATFQERFQDVYKQKLQPLLEKQLVEITNTHFRCTKKGYPIMNDILIELM